MDDEPRIYREEVLTIMGVLADGYVNTERILWLLEDDDGEAEEEDT